MDTKLNINSIEAGSITYDKLNQDVVDKFNAKADSASVTNVSNRVTAIEGLIATDSDAVIDKWDEVVTFLDGISATDDLEGILANKANTSTVNDLMTMLDGKLDETGGTIYKDGNPVPLTIKSTGEYAGLGLKIGENGRAVLAYYGGLDWRVTNESYQSEARILHNLNFESLIGNTYLKTDGTNAMSYGANISWGDENKGQEDYEGYSTGFRLLHYNPSSRDYRGGIHVGARYGWQLVREANTERMYVRYIDPNAKTWSDWKTLAFTDSDITGNAATATALKNKVSLWGNEFDGTQSLDNAHIQLNNARAIYWKAADKTTNIEALSLNNENTFLIGQGVAKAAGSTVIYGNNIKFCYGTAGSSAQTAMTITDEGRVLIKRQTNNLDAIIGTKGLVHIEGGSTKTALGSAPANGLTIGYDTIGGLAQWIHETNFSGNIQAMNLAGTATAYALNLNPLGGAVNVGGKLAPNANNSLSLGTSSYRWSDVYSVLGDFNGAVTIRSNADGAELLRFSTDRPWKFSQLGAGAATSLCLSPDATSKSFVIADYDTSNVFEFWINGSNSSATFNSSLAVAKLTTFNGGAYIPSGQKLTIGDAVLEYDGGLKSSHNFIGNLTGTATKVSNVLKFGSKTFDGSSEQTITATDLGISGSDCNFTNAYKTKLDGIATGATKVTKSTVTEWGFAKTDDLPASITEDTVATWGFVKADNHTHNYLSTLGGNISGNLTVTGTVSSAGGFFHSSDETLKNFIGDVDVDLDKLAALPKKYFTWKDGDDSVQIGTSAQEVQKVYPEIVNTDDTGKLSVDYTKLSVIALSAVDKLNEKNKELENRLQRIESLLSTLNIK